MERYFFIAVVLLADCFQCDAATAQTTTEQRDIPTVTITAKPVGPPLWKITRGQNTLWLFVDLPVVPKDLKWDSSRVDHILAESEVFVNGPTIKAGGVTSLFTRKARSVGALLDTMELLESGYTLDKVIDPALYGKLSESLPADVLHYISAYKPWFAGNRLMNSWAKRDGFVIDTKADVDPELERLRRKHGVAKVRSHLDVELDEVELHLRQQLSLPNDFGTACLASAVHFHENAEVLKMALSRWYAGDLPVSSVLNPLQACAHQNPKVNWQKFQQVLQIWMLNLQQALADHRTSFAVIPLGILLEDHGAPLRQWLEQQDVDIGQPNNDN